MKQVYKPYWEWECFINGMWKPATDRALLKKAILFTSDYLQYGKAMREVVLIWENTMLHHLTNPSINKNAFIGHCACSYRHKLPESIVRQAWSFLSEEEKRLANNEANKAYLLWREKQSKELKSTPLFG